MHWGAAACGGRKRDRNEGWLALARRERKKPRPERGAEVPCCFGRKAAERVFVAGLLRDEDRWLFGQVVVSSLELWGGRSRTDRLGTYVGAWRGESHEVYSVRNRYLVSSSREEGIDDVWGN